MRLLRPLYAVPRIRVAAFVRIAPAECAVRVECPRCGWWRARLWSRDEVLALPAPVNMALRARAAAWLGGPMIAHHRDEIRAVAWRVARGVSDALEVGHVARAYAPSWRLRACVTAVRVEITSEYCGPAIADFVVRWSDDPVAVVMRAARAARFDVGEDVLGLVRSVAKRFSWGYVA